MTITVQSLLEYLLDVVDLQDSSASAGVKESLDYLSSIYVMNPANDSMNQFKPPTDVSHTAHSTQSHVVNRVIKMILFQSGTGRQADLLIQGYRKINSSTNASLEDVHGIENYFPNTIVNSLKSKHWQWLLTKIGDHLMQHLLLNTILLQKLENGCYLQLNGVPLSKECYNSVYRIVGDERDTSAKNGTAAGSLQVDAKRLINRQQMFFHCSSNSGYLPAGVPARHMLNKAKQLTEEQAIKLLVMEVFPGEFSRIGSKRKRKSRWRLKQINPLMGRMLRKHRHFDYFRCLRKFCPVPYLDKPACANAAASDLIPLNVSQANDESSTNDPIIGDNPLNHYSRYHQVYSFVRCILQKIIPKAFWGCQSNYKALLAIIKRFIRLRKFETVSVGYVMQNFKLSKCKWLSSAERQRISNPTDLKKRQRIVMDFLFWLFQGYLIPLLRNTFYITDSSSHRNRMFYYRQDLWSDLTRPALGNFCASIFDRITQGEVQEILKNPRAGYSQLRLIPKESGLRPIINLRKRLPLRSTRGTRHLYLPSVNTVLQNAFQVLNQEKSCRPDLMGASILGMNDIHNRLKRFRVFFNERQQQDPNLKLYFAKTDVKCAFDSVNQDKLLEILQDILLDSGRNVKRQTVRRAMNSEEFPQFPELASNLSEQMTNSIFTDHVLYSYENGQDVYDLIHDHVSNNLIKVGKGLYRQIVGIPQGSILSTLLCSLFYGHFESECLAHLQLNEDGILLRFVDDFLLITFSVTKAKQFLRIMHKGNPSYGCFVNAGKSLINFDSGPIEGHQLNQIPKDAKFPWCGLLVDPKTLDLGHDNSRYFGCHLGDTMTAETTGKNLVSKSVFFLKYRLNPLYLDTSMNSTATVMTNLLETFVICAMKFHLSVKSMSNNCNQEFQFNSIQEIIRAAMAIIFSKISGFAGKECNAEFTVSKQEILWLGLEAFSMALGRKQSRYQQLLRAISGQMEAMRLRLKRLFLLSLASGKVREARLLDKIQF